MAIIIDGKKIAAELRAECCLKKELSPDLML